MTGSSHHGLSRDEVLYEIDVLAEEWRDSAQTMRMSGNRKAGNAIEACADELEEVLENAE